MYLLIFTLFISLSLITSKENLLSTSFNISIFSLLGAAAASTGVSDFVNNIITAERPIKIKTAAKQILINFFN